MRRQLLSKRGLEPVSLPIVLSPLFQEEARPIAASERPLRPDFVIAQLRNSAIVVRTLRLRWASFVAFALAACVFLCGLPMFDLDGEDVHTYGHGDKADLPLHAPADFLAPVLDHTLKLEPPRFMSTEQPEPLVLGNPSSGEIPTSWHLRPPPRFLRVSLLSTKA